MVRVSDRQLRCIATSFTHSTSWKYGIFGRPFPLVDAERREHYTLWGGRSVPHSAFSLPSRLLCCSGCVTPGTGIHLSSPPHQRRGKAGETKGSDISVDDSSDAAGLRDGGACPTAHHPAGCGFGPL